LARTCVAGEIIDGLALGAPVTDERHQCGNQQELAFVVHSDSASEGGSATSSVTDGYPWIKSI
jgi:hypothetical protein